MDCGRKASHHPVERLRTEPFRIRQVSKFAPGSSCVDSGYEARSAAGDSMRCLCVSVLTGVNVLWIVLSSPYVQTTCTA